MLSSTVLLISLLIITTVHGIRPWALQSLLDSICWQTATDCLGYMYFDETSRLPTRPSCLAAPHATPSLCIRDADMDPRYSSNSPSNRYLQ